MPSSNKRTGALNSVDAPPKASVLIESMRDIGYSLETALADVVDNAITAGAQSVQIHVDAVGPAISIGIADDGRGMDREELLQAMRLGSRHPHERRDLDDLGRFGLGLKTASFSQCRRLTVMTRKAGQTAIAIWDLDHVAREDSWSLLMPESDETVPFATKLGAEGTLVVWERMDRAVDPDPSELARKHFIRRVDETRQHLELVFHRYLAGESGVPRIRIFLNELPLKPFDPFNSGHAATIRGQTEKVQVGEHIVAITAFTLPHHRNVSAAEWDHYAGPAGYLKNQGFYLYRGKRLIIHGTWFGLARQMELTKLTRVRIDMPNGLDSSWHIDVKKASARPPLQVRERLQNILSQIGAPSRTIYTQRGRRLHDGKLPIWQRVQENNSIVYRLNEHNPIIGSFSTSLPPTLADAFARLMHIVSAGLPMDAIFADLAGNPESVKQQQVTDDVLSEMLAITRERMLETGIDPAVIAEMLQATEPFRSNWDRVELMLEQLQEASDK
jgi:hypothetical protein